MCRIVKGLQCDTQGADVVALSVGRTRPLKRRQKPWWVRPCVVAAGGAILHRSRSPHRELNDEPGSQSLRESGPATPILTVEASPEGASFVVNKSLATPGRQKPRIQRVPRDGKILDLLAFFVMLCYVMHHQMICSILLCRRRLRARD